MALEWGHMHLYVLHIYTHINLSNARITIKWDIINVWGQYILALPLFHLEILAEMENEISVVFVIMVDT